MADMDKDKDGYISLEEYISKYVALLYCCNNFDQCSSHLGLLAILSIMLLYHGTILRFIFLALLADVYTLINILTPFTPFFVHPNLVFLPRRLWLILIGTKMASFPKLNLCVGWTFLVFILVTSLTSQLNHRRILFVFFFLTLLLIILTTLSLC